MSRAARAAYDVAVVDLEPDDQTRDNARAWFIGLFTTLLGDPGGVLPRVRVEIWNSDTDELVFARLEDAGIAAELLKNKIENDLDQMGADTFAAEWGLPMPRGE